MEPQLSLADVRRLARELAARREAAFDEVRGEVELLKASLRERAAAVAERERELADLQARLDANGLAAEIANAQRLARQAEVERRLAEAERARLDEREQQIREVEKELAALRIELEHQRQAKRPSASARQKELDEREAALDAREAALATRERVLAGDTMSMPAPPSFNDGLAALARPARSD